MEKGADYEVGVSLIAIAINETDRSLFFINLVFLYGMPFLHWFRPLRASISFRKKYSQYHFFEFAFRLLTSHFFLRGQKEVTKKKATPSTLSLRDTLVVDLFETARA